MTEITTTDILWLLGAYLIFVGYVIYLNTKGEL